MALDRRSVLAWSRAFEPGALGGGFSYSLHKHLVPHTPKGTIKRITLYKIIRMKCRLHRYSSEFCPTSIVDSQIADLQQKHWDPIRT